MLIQYSSDLCHISLLYHTKLNFIIAFKSYSIAYYNTSLKIVCKGSFYVKTLTVLQISDLLYAKHQPVAVAARSKA